MDITNKGNFIEKNDREIVSITDRKRDGTIDSINEYNDRIIDNKFNRTKDSKLEFFRRLK